VDHSLFDDTNRSTATLISTNASVLTRTPCLSYSFWGVFFVGYISRPAGAVLFGHLGDTKGRSMCLLISVLVMGIPTVSTEAAAQHDELHS
jgi:MFS family permease